jgi:hypothetical protein
VDAQDRDEPLTEPEGLAAEDAGPVRGSLFPWVLFAVAFVTAAVFAWLWYQGRGSDSGQPQVKQTATEFVVALTNFRAETIDQDVARIKGFAVGDFASQVDQVFGPNFFQQAKKAKVVSTGRIRSVFVQSLSGGSASVFAVVDETFQNATESPRTEVVRFNIMLIDTKDGWKVESVELLQSATPSPFA